MLGIASLTCLGLLACLFAGTIRHFERIQAAQGSGVTVVPLTEDKVWAFALAVLALLCLGIVTGIPAVVCGLVAKRVIRRSGGVVSGKGMALAGTVAGSVVLVVALLLLAATLARLRLW